ncbi:MAG: DUF3108 domain-containing protein [Methylophilaceae bacterium]|nr:DUF3108 domain-containing protein [Methyloradius sp.]
MKMPSIMWLNNSFKLLILALISSFSLAGVAQAAPPTKINLEYMATRDGKPFANVTESYKQENGRYKIESVTAGIGVFALLGKRVMTSEGEVTAQGLKPAHFELRQGDNPKKALISDFDWSASTLNLQIKGEASSFPLDKGAQDLASFPYQFMFSPPKADDFYLAVNSGRKLGNNHYKVTERNVTIEIDGKKYKALHLVDASEDAKDGKELWLGVAQYNLPIKLVLKDETGATIEQTLTSIHAE